MQSQKNMLQGVFLFLIVATMIAAVWYFQHKSYVNSAKQNFKPLTIEEKIRFKGGLDSY